MDRQLYIACINGDYEQVYHRLKESNIDINYQYVGGCTLLYFASRYGYVKIVRLLLDHDADINKPDNVSITPLASAVSHGHIDVVRLLLDRGADITIPTLSGNTVQQTVKERGSQEMKELIENYFEIPIKEPDEN